MARPSCKRVIQMARVVCINVFGLDAERPAKMEIRAHGS